MKRIIPIVAFVLMAMTAGAQNCESIVLPLFDYDTVRVQDYPIEKLMQRCWYSQASFYESDTIPIGVEVINISEVQENLTGNHLPQNFVVDLTTLSFYAYNFRSFQARYRWSNVTLCFYTPSSTHPYLVLRSIEESMQIASEMEADYYRNNE